MGILSGKVVLVVGAGNGIGRAQALGCSAAGAQVVVNDLGCDRDGRGADAGVADAIATEIRAAGGVALADAQDAAASGAAQRLVERTVEHFGRLDGVIYSAGIAHRSSLDQLRDSEVDRLWHVQVRGAITLARQAARVMTESGSGGSIVLNASTWGAFGATRQSGLSLCAGALIAFVRAAATELRRPRVRINALAPTARTRSTADLQLFQGISADSLQPEHVAPASTFLLSDLAQDISGEVVGCAGARLYLLTGRETAGAFAPNGMWTVEQIAEQWKDIG